MRFKVPIYETVVHIKLFDTTLELDKYYVSFLKRKGLCQEGSGLAEAVTLFHVTGKNEAFIFLTKNASFNTIVHESTHLTFRIFKFNNILISESMDDENLALLNGFIAEEMLKVINKIRCS